MQLPAADDLCESGKGLLFREIEIFFKSVLRVRKTARLVHDTEMPKQERRGIVVSLTFTSSLLSTLTFVLNLCNVLLESMIFVSKR